MIGTWLGLFSAAFSIGTWAVWMRRIEQVSVPRDRSFFVGAGAFGAGLGIAALAAGAGWLGGIAGTLGLLAGGAFVGLRALSRQDPGTHAVAVGSPLLDFAAPDDQGATFELASLRGRPILLKFFRGHW
jgi:hypothetical protein